MEFGLLYFSGDGSTTEADKYQLLIEGAKFADQHGFSSVWTPERHFHPFGGLYPNPSVMASALAMITERVHLRAGSVVLPLQHPLRVAEEWAVVDNLSQGRVGIAFAPGWHVDDFTLRPQNYRDRQAAMWRDVEVVQKLWRGEAVTFANGLDQPVDLQTLPRPLQSHLPTWITCHAPDTFTSAGRLGANVLTSLLHETPAEISKKIQLYRDARTQQGHDPAAGVVTLMLHTFMGEDWDQVRQQVKQPFCNYLRTHLGLVESLVKKENLPIKLDRLTEEDIQHLLEFGFENFLNGRTLIGPPEHCRQMVQQVQDMGVDEIACLIDFGVPHVSVFASLQHLRALKDALCGLTPRESSPHAGAYSALSFFD